MTKEQRMAHSKEHYQELGSRTYSLMRSGQREMSRHTTRLFKRCLRDEVCDEHRAIAQDEYRRGYVEARLG